MYTYTVGYGKEEVALPKGQIIAGAAIGIIMFGQGGFPLPPGCVGNASTYDFPVYYKAIEAGTVERVVSPKPDPLVSEQLIKTGKELEKQGCRAVIGGCGYFANYQPEVAAALNIPCFLSSLMQVPIILRSLKPNQKVGVICAHGDAMRNAPALKNCGVDPNTVVIAGGENMPEMKKVLESVGYSPEKFEQELVGLAKQMVSENPDVGAFLLECTDFPPYAWAVQKAVRLPVFDFSTMISWVQSAVVRRPFAGFM